jgi:hypothetical protein
MENFMPPKKVMENFMPPKKVMGYGMVLGGLRDIA